MTPREREMIRWGKLLFERRLISGWGGNLSCRLGRRQFLITGQHAPLGFLSAKDLVRITADGTAVNRNQRASSETPMHLAVYHGTNAEVVVHAHPPMVVAFSLMHDRLVPISFEEKYTIGEVPVIAQETPTVTNPELVVEELQYRPVVIIKGHGTIAIGKNFEEAFLFTDLLEEAVHCQFFKQRLGAAAPSGPVLSSAQTPAQSQAAAVVPAQGQSYRLFSREHMEALVSCANNDPEFRGHGEQARLTTSLTLHMEENNAAWTVAFVSGEITDISESFDGQFLISGKGQWWEAVFKNRIDPFLATQQGKLKLKRGELAQLSRWYKPFQRAFTLWQTIPIQ